MLEVVAGMLQPGDEQHDVPETKYNLLNRDIVKRVKIMTPSDPETLDIKPRRRGRPRKAPPGLQVTSAVQTSVQINAMLLD